MYSGIRVYSSMSKLLVLRDPGVFFGTELLGTQGPGFIITSISSNKHCDFQYQQGQQWAY